MGGASRRKQWQKVEIAKEGFVGPDAGPGLRSAAPQQGLKLGWSWRCRHGAAPHPGTGAGGGTEHGAPVALLLGAL